MADEKPPAGEQSAFEYLPAALRWLRQQRHLSQRELAVMSGIPAAMLSRYENGQAVPRLSTLGRLLDGLGATVTGLGWAFQAVQEGQESVAISLDLPPSVPPVERAALQMAAVVLREVVNAKQLAVASKKD